MQYRLEKDVEPKFIKYLYNDCLEIKFNDRNQVDDKFACIEII